MSCKKVLMKTCFSTLVCSSSKKTLRIWAIFLFGKCGVLHI